MRAARYLQVPVWDLEQAPVRYRDRALIAERAEAKAEAAAAERARRKG